MQRVQNDVWNYGSCELSQERLLLEQICTTVEAVRNFAPQSLKEQEVHAAHAITLVEPENALFVETLQALEVALVDGRSVGHVNSYLTTRLKQLRLFLGLFHHLGRSPCHCLRRRSATKQSTQRGLFARLKVAVDLEVRHDRKL